LVYTVFWVAVTLAPALLFFFGFKMLPKENWQIIGSIPVKKEENGSWTGLNLTYYGLFNAIACGYSVLLLIVLLGSISISSWMILFIVISILLICIPASRILARWVEKKTNTLTLGGASFAGFLFLPWGLWLTRMVPDPFAGFQVPVLPGLAAVSIAYVFGESLGRLACVSFGCCYGKALREVHPALRRLFTNHCFIFSGKTKKIAYAHGLDGQKGYFPDDRCLGIVSLSERLIHNGVFGDTDTLTGMAVFVGVLSGGLPGDRENIRLPAHEPGHHRLCPRGVTGFL